MRGMSVSKLIGVRALLTQVRWFTTEYSSSSGLKQVRPAFVLVNPSTLRYMTGLLSRRVTGAFLVVSSPSPQVLNVATLLMVTPLAERSRMPAWLAWYLPVALSVVWAP